MKKIIFIIALSISLHAAAMDDEEIDADALLTQETSTPEPDVVKVLEDLKKLSVVDLLSTAEAAIRAVASTPSNYDQLSRDLKINYCCIHHDMLKALGDDYKHFLAIDRSQSQPWGPRSADCQDVQKTRIAQAAKTDRSKILKIIEKLSHINSLNVAQAAINNINYVALPLGEKMIYYDLFYKMQVRLNVSSYHSASEKEAARRFREETKENH